MVLNFFFSFVMRGMRVYGVLVLVAIVYIWGSGGCYMLEVRFRRVSVLVEGLDFGFYVVSYIVGCIA